MDKMRMSFGLEHRPRPPRHYFDFPTEVRSAVDSYTSQAVSAIDPATFRQEADYVAAIAARLEGCPYSGKYGNVTFKSTIVSSRGPKSAESWSGADWIITAVVSDGSTSIEKAIVIQAKLGLIADLSATQCDKLKDQVEKMTRLTRAPKVLEIAESGGQREPRIVSGGDGLLNNRRLRSVSLGRYISSRVITTLHGDTRPGFVENVQDSQLTRLHVMARLER